VVFGSYWLNLYSNDPQHFGNMLSNAKDLANGHLPYKYIFVLYGILTTLIQSIAFKVGGNLISLVLATSIAYALGLVLMYVLALKITNSIRLASFVILSIFLLHPVVILPWSNYIAFPFIILGFLSIYNNNQSIKRLFIGGFFFGLAVLAREGIIIPVSLIFIFYIFLHYTKFILKDIIAFLFGILLPITVFFIYLFINDLLSFWYKLSVELPNIYRTELFHDAGFRGAILFFYDILRKSTHPDYRWLLIGCIYITNAAFFISHYKMRNNKPESRFVLLLCLSSFLFISTSLHLREIFRLATGSIIGLIPLYVYLDKYKKANIFFIFIAFALGTTLFKQNSGIYPFPSRQTINESIELKSPSVLAGQRLPMQTMSYYRNIEEDLYKIQKLKCGIKYHYNLTRDAFLQTISPFNQYQVAPSFIGGGGVDVEQLRPDLDINIKIKSSNDLIFFYIARDPDNLKDNKFPNNYQIFSIYEVPEARWIPPNQKLMILVPNACL